MGKYIGIPYKLGGNSIDGLDCYSFVRYFMSEEYGIELRPVIMGKRSLLEFSKELRDNKVRKEFIAIPEPVEGCAALMARGKVACHTGIYTNKGVLHCLERFGVVFTAFEKLNLLGLKVVGYYEHSDLRK